MDTEDPAPADGNDPDELEARMSRRAHIAGLFHKADAAAAIKLAERARSRIVEQPEVGVATISDGTKGRDISRSIDAIVDQLVPLPSSPLRVEVPLLWPGSVMVAT